MAPKHIPIPPTPPPANNRATLPASPTPQPSQAHNHQRSSVYSFSPSKPQTSKEVFHPDNLHPAARHSPTLVLKAIHKAKTVMRNTNIKNNALQWRDYRHTLQCTACHKTPAQKPASTTITDPQKRFKTTWFEKATTNPNLSITLCPECMFDSPWVAASNREVLITAPTFSNGWSITAATWKIHKNLYTKNAIVSLILNQDNPPPTFITAESITQQSKRTLCDVQLDDYKDDINEALAERRATKRPKMSEQTYQQPTNEYTHPITKKETLCRRTQHPNTIKCLPSHLYARNENENTHRCRKDLSHQHHTHGQTNK